MTYPGITREEAANCMAQNDTVKLRMEIAEKIATSIKNDPSIYQCIDKEKLALVMSGEGCIENILYVFRMCHLKFKVEVVDGSYVDEWY